MGPRLSSRELNIAPNASSTQRRALIAALRGLPRGWLSRLAGQLASLSLPQPLQRWEIHAFGRLVGVDFAEVRRPLESFSSLQEFFTRELVEGARPIDREADVLVAPCDGAWGEAGEIQGGRLFQLKGRPYALEGLLRSAADSATFEGGHFATFYLSPRDYHRFHTPYAARVVRARYIPGTLWPVNRAGLENVDGVFAENERICAFMECGTATYCAVAVGATLVGKVRVRFDELTTREPASTSIERTYAEPTAFEKGEEWGRFEFGSTLVLLFPAGFAQLDLQPPGTRLRLGTPIGKRLQS